MTGQPNEADQDANLRIWAVCVAAQHIAIIPGWRRPASPMALARDMYEFVKAGRDLSKPMGDLRSIGPTPGAAA